MNGWTKKNLDYHGGFATLQAMAGAALLSAATLLFLSQTKLMRKDSLSRNLTFEEKQLLSELTEALADTNTCSKSLSGLSVGDAIPKIRSDGSLFFVSGGVYHNLILKGLAISSIGSPSASSSLRPVTITATFDKSLFSDQKDSQKQNFFGSLTVMTTINLYATATTSAPASTSKPVITYCGQESSPDIVGKMFCDQIGGIYTFGNEAGAKCKKPAAADPAETFCRFAMAGTWDSTTHKCNYKAGRGCVEVLGATGTGTSCAFPPTDSTSANPGTGITSANGGWSAWTDISSCSSPQQKLKQIQRTCTNPTPISGGAQCTRLDGTSTSSTNLSETVSAPCKIDGGWSDWILGDECSAPGNFVTDTRDCTNPAPQAGGATCVADANGLGDTRLRGLSGPKSNGCNCVDWQNCDSQYCHPIYKVCTDALPATTNTGGSKNFPGADLPACSCPQLDFPNAAYIDAISCAPTYDRCLGDAQSTSIINNFDSYDCIEANLNIPKVANMQNCSGSHNLKCFCPVDLSKLPGQGN